jgi:hypothetical protein
MVYWTHLSSKHLHRMEFASRFGVVADNHIGAIMSTPSPSHRRPPTAMRFSVLQWMHDVMTTGHYNQLPCQGGLLHVMPTTGRTVCTRHSQCVIREGHGI